MLERKVLNLKKPLLKTWSSESHLMSMILNQEDAMQWIFNNYINLLGYSIPSKNQNLLSFFPKPNPIDAELPLNTWTGCPFLEVHLVSPEFVKNRNILEYILYAIENDYYVYLTLCQEYLKTRVNPKTHKTFIYGFDKKNNIFFAADHYDTSKYSLAEIEFNEFEKAYNAVYLENDYSSKQKNALYENQFIVIAKCKSFKYDFNLEWFKIQLQDYLNSSYSLNCIIPFTVSQKTTMYFGISSYDLVVDYMTSLLEDKKSVKKDWRIFTLICDHKKLLKMRTDYFYSHQISNYTQEELEEYKKLHELSEIMLNLFIKNVVTNDTKCLEKIRDICKDMKHKEFYLLEQLYARI